MTVIDADELMREGELDAALDPGGIPRRPVVLVRPGTADFVAPRRRGPSPIVVLVLADDRPAPPALGALADIVLGPPGAVHVTDVVAIPDPVAAARELARSVARAPRAALSLAQLLRSRAYEDVERGLLAESALYSTLQAGREFAVWRAGRPSRRAGAARDEGPRVHARRDGDTLAITLTRPAKANALDTRMRDELLGALQPARWDGRLAVELAGEGAAFCTGGDLDEFGGAADPAAAHLVRTEQSLGAVLHELAARTTVTVHGHCHGAGVELAAFAGTVRARPDARFTLPEVGMGLIPGAGGTTSLPRRIGPRRTLWLALTTMALPADTALAWGLVDAIE